MAVCLKNVLDVSIRKECDLVMWFKLHAFVAFGKLELLMCSGLEGEDGTTVTRSSHPSVLKDMAALMQHPRNSLCMSELSRRLPL